MKCWFLWYEFSENIYSLCKIYKYWQQIAEQQIVTAYLCQHVYRYLSAWKQNINKQKRFGHIIDEDILSPNYYWKNETPVFNTNLLDAILADCNIDTVVTHTAPSFCELQDKAGICTWTKDDPKLIPDLNEERSTMDAIHASLKEKEISHWCYGHFHQSWHASIEGTFFKMLDIMELYEIR